MIPNRDKAEKRSEARRKAQRTMEYKLLEFSRIEKENRNAGEEIKRTTLDLEMLSRDKERITRDLQLVERKIDLASKKLEQARQKFAESGERLKKLTDEMNLLREIY